MAKSVVSDQSDSVIDAAFVDLVERLTQLLQSGQTVNVEELAHDHPHHVPRLRQLLPAMQATAELGLALAVSSHEKRTQSGVIAIRSAWGTSDSSAS